MERRGRKRFRVKVGALAFLGTVPSTIVDISESGMAINYVVFEKEPARRFLLDIFFSADDFYLADISSALVSDVQFLPESRFSAIRVKRFGLRFCELSEEQKSRIQYFILHNTTCEV
ncbi:MAG TPA: PilZ domain-containing protein [Desulfobulbus sp.]|nr:PilZ domain-containing protein [Desulfobulbus sp.]HHD64231.1 PilZ domain-containing protein [Desulfobulbaceae bacterium]